MLSQLFSYRDRLVTREHFNLLVQHKQGKFGDWDTNQKSKMREFDISRFERMKTVFGHAIIEEGTVTSIYNV